KASVPLATPMQNCESQNCAKSCSNPCTIGPPTNPAVSSAVSRTARSSSRSSRWTVTRSRNGIIHLPSRLPGDERVTMCSVDPRIREGLTSDLLALHRCCQTRQSLFSLRELRQRRHPGDLEHGLPPV